MTAKQLTLAAACSMQLATASLAQATPALPTKNIVIAPQTTVLPARPTPLGHFVGFVKTLWNDDGRNMTLLEDFSYIDPDGLEWKAPKGLVTDGASIPQEAWSIIGGPFEGTYRLAAVVHDAACDTKDRSWESVHEMFYRAMLTAHVDELKAKLMYAAVYHFGPRWNLQTVAQGVKKGDANSVVDSIQHAVHATNSDVQTVQKDIPLQAGESVLDEKLDITVKFIPPANHFTQDDLNSLEQMIKQREAKSPGSVSLEEIRNYQSLGGAQ